MAEELVHKRKFQRYPADLEVILYRSGETAIGRIMQISRGGCLLEVPARITVQGSEIRLSFQLSGDLPSINCKGETVYYVVGRGAGVAFTEISAYFQDLITSHFEKQPFREC
jgi:hypothetical protein